MLGLLMPGMSESCFSRLLVTFLGCKAPPRPDLVQADSSRLKIWAAGFCFEVNSSSPHQLKTWTCMFIRAFNASFQLF